MPRPSTEARARWVGLSCFLENGRIEIDYSVVERPIRPTGLIRKNALLAGSDGEAGLWAIIASLIATVKGNWVEPQAYLADVIASIVADYPKGHPDTSCHGPTPHNSSEP